MQHLARMSAGWNLHHELAGLDHRAGDHRLPGREPEPQVIRRVFPASLVRYVGDDLCGRQPVSRGHVASMAWGA